MTDNQETITSKQLLDAVVEGIQEKKGVNITVLDLTSIENTISDYFVICDGDSNVHVDTIADSVDEYVRKTVGDKPLHVEGRDNAEWILIDYMNVVVHLFQRKVREFYNLEGLWADGERHDIANFD